MTNNNNTPHIYSALAQVTTDIGLLGIDKGQTNSFQKFSFRSIDQVLTAFNTVLSKNQVFMSHRMVNVELKELGVDQKGSRVWFLSTGLEVDFISGKDGSTLPQPSYIYGGNDGKDVTKLTGQLTSYLLKELLFKQFVVPVVGAEDIDSRDETGRPTSLVSLPNKKGVVWTEPNWTLGQESVIDWASTMTGWTTQEAASKLSETPANAQGKKGTNFRQLVRDVWEAK